MRSHPAAIDIQTRRPFLRPLLRLSETVAHPAVTVTATLIRRGTHREIRSEIHSEIRATEMLTGAHETTPLPSQIHVSGVTGPRAVSHLQNPHGVLDMILRTPRAVLHAATRHPRRMTETAGTLVLLAGLMEE